MGMAAGSWSYPRAVLAAPRQAPASPARTHHRLVARPARGLHPAPHTLHPAPCTPHPVPYTLHPATTTWPQGPSAPPAAQGAAGTRGGGPGRTGSAAAACPGSGHVLTAEHDYRGT